MGKSLFGTKTKTKSSSDPWAPFSSYITGKQDGVTGIPENAYNLYQQGGFNPQMQDFNDLYTNYLRDSSNQYSGFRDSGFNLLGKSNDIAGGQFSSNFNPVSMVDMNAERAKLGAIDPTEAFIRLLSGRPDTQYLDQQASALTNNLTRNTNENVMPGLRSSAAISGQYGGSRQGIAEGLAASRLNQDLALPISQMYGNALEQAQNRMMGTSQYLNDNAYNTAFGNANLGLQNNSQLMQKNQVNLANMMQSIPMAKSGFDLLSGTNDVYGQNYQNYINAMMMPQNTNWQNINNYANLMYQGAGLGGTSKGTQTATPGIIPSIFGTAAGIGGIASGFSEMGGVQGFKDMFK